MTKAQWVYSVQFKTVSLRSEKKHYALHPSLRSFSSVAFEAVPMFVSKAENSANSCCCEALAVHFEMRQSTSFILILFFLLLLFTSSDLTTRRHVH